MKTIRVTTRVELIFRIVVLIEKLVFDASCEKIGEAGSHFGTHHYTINLFVIVLSYLSKL